MNDSDRLDLLIRVLYRYDLARCRNGWTLFGRSELTKKPIITDFYPSVRELLDAVEKLNLKEFDL